jgi:hypothetical protein
MVMEGREDRAGHVKQGQKGESSEKDKDGEGVYLLMWEKIRFGISVVSIAKEYKLFPNRL